MDPIQNREPPISSPYDVQRVLEVRGHRPLVLLVIPHRIRRDLMRRDLERAAVVQPERQVEVRRQIGKWDLGRGEVEAMEYGDIPVEIEEVRA